MTGQGKAGRTRERDYGVDRTGRVASGARGQTSASTLVDTVMQLQRDAGNLAVARALAAPGPSTAHLSLFPLQRQPAAGGGTSSTGVQLAAVWDAQVVVPTARAADRLARAEVDPKGARTDLETALRTILTVSTATPAGDPDRLRLQIIERRTRGVLDLVDQRFGGGKSDDRLVNDMINIRSEAATLGPLLEHAPDLQVFAAPAAGDAPVGATEAPASEASTQTPTPGQGSARQAAPGPTATAPGETAASTTATTSGATSSGAVDGSIADDWDLFVVRRLWYGQQGVENDPRSAITHYTVASYRILEFIQATPRGHPNRLRLMTLHAGVQSVSDLVSGLDPVFGGDPLVDRATEAYEAAAAMGEILMGEQSPATSAGPDSAQGAGGSSEAPGTTEPDFTWERERPPMQDDTALERP